MMMQVQFIMMRSIEHNFLKCHLHSITFFIIFKANNEHSNFSNTIKIISCSNMGHTVYRFFYFYLYKTVNNYYLYGIFCFAAKLAERTKQTVYVQQIDVF